MLQARYPWIKLTYVPAGCTPASQPMDAGIIAKEKGGTRGEYGRWAMEYTLSELNRGVKPEDIKLPFDAQTNKKQVSMAMSNAWRRLTKEEIVHCWRKCCDGHLMDAFDSDTQRQACEQASRLFTGLNAQPIECEPDCDGGVGVADDLEGDDAEEFLSSLFLE
jgi:hypothetical protein